MVVKTGIFKMVRWNKGRIKNSSSSWLRITPNYNYAYPLCI